MSSSQTSRARAQLVRDMVFEEITDDVEAIIEKYGLEPYRRAMAFPKRKEAEAK